MSFLYSVHAVSLRESATSARETGVHILNQLYCSQADHSCHIQHCYVMPLSSPKYNGAFDNGAIVKVLNNYKLKNKNFY